MIIVEMPGQPAQFQSAQQGSNGSWNNDLCGCLSDMGICLTTWCFPCVQYGLNYEKGQR